MKNDSTASAVMDYELMKQRAEAAEAALQAAEARADRLIALNLPNKIEELEAEVEHQKALVDSWMARAAQLEADNQRIRAASEHQVKFYQDLIRTVEGERDEARRQLEQAQREIAQLSIKARHVWLDEALNEGDGVYRP